MHWFNNFNQKKRNVDPIPCISVPVLSYYDTFKGGGTAYRMQTRIDYGNRYVGSDIAFLKTIKRC